jgi:hypothetical protein
MMSQHFLLTAAARTLSLASIYRDGEAKAYETFKAMRWTDGEPVCPRCGSVTSGTIFASRKMAFVDLLAAICIFVNAVKGLSALQMSRDLDVQYKTAFVLAHKLREAIAAEVAGHTLKGEVEINGAYFGDHIRPANLKEDRIDRRLAEHQTGARRVVVALRQRKGRTLTFVTMAEAEGVELANRWVDRMAVVCSRTRRAIGTICIRHGRLGASITARLTRWTAQTRTWWKASSSGCARW